MKKATKKIYYGDQTAKSIDNFPFPHHKTYIDLIYAIVEIKQAAAYAHREIGEMEASIADAIIQSCQEILLGGYVDQFVTVGLQGGAGTSINMNVNEVVAARASEILGKPIHPNDDVNRSQSTNDVNPSALKIVCLRLSAKLLESTDKLIHSLEKKGKEFRRIAKLARTHMQDAVPITLGEEFLSYATIIKRDKQRIEEFQKYLYDLNLGGTAVGNSINASNAYIKSVYFHLQKITGLPVVKATNFMSQTSSQSDFYHLSSLLCALSIDLSKIATDIRFMSSGPRGGIGELRLEPLQKGSSIMPGKVNPVIPESINQVYYFISGKHLTIEHAVEGAHLELGIMFPIIADSIITSLKFLESAVKVFNEKCISILVANEEVCKRYLENSTAYATLFVPKLGYDVVSKIVKEAVKTGKTLREIVIERKFLTQAEFDSIIS